MASAAPVPFAGIAENGVYPQESLDSQAQPVSPVWPHSLHSLPNGGLYLYLIVLPKALRNNFYTNPKLEIRNPKQIQNSNYRIA